MTKKFNIYNVRFKTQYQLTATLLRFAEHYESPRFRGQVFTLEEFMDWYATTRKGIFTYFTDWSGFNIPSFVLKPFLAGKFNPLTVKESAFLRLFSSIRGSFYVIATVESETDILAHEVTHGLYFLYPEYGKAVRDTIKKFDTSAFKVCLKRMGYCGPVLVDEINAYVLTGLSENMKWVQIGALRRQLQSIFLDYFGFRIWNEDEKKRLLRKIYFCRFKV